MSDSARLKAAGASPETVAAFERLEATLDEMASRIKTLELMNCQYHVEVKDVVCADCKKDGFGKKR